MSDSEHPTSYEGTWWAPAFDLPPVGGSYTPSQVDGLRVFGSLLPAGYERLFWDSSPILGNSAGRKITLLGCTLGGTRTIGRTVSETKVHASTAVIGAHFEDEDAAKFHAASLDLDGLAILADSPEFDWDYTDEESETVAFQRAPDHVANLPEGGKVTLRDGIVGRRTLWLVDWRRRPNLHVEFGRDLSIEEIEHGLIRPLRYLVSLASDRESLVTSFAVFHRDHRYEHIDHEIPLTVRGYGEKTENSSVDNDRHRRVIDIQEMPFDRLIPKWFRLSTRLGPVLDLIFSSDGASGYIENQFFDLATAVEGFYEVELRRKTDALRPEEAAVMRELIEAAPPAHKEWVKRRLRRVEDVTYAEKVQSLIEYCGTWLYSHIGSSGSWQNAVARKRNSFAHPTSDDSLFADHILTGRLRANLTVILRLALLRLLGASQNKCEEYFRGTFAWRDSFAVGPRDFPEIYT
ncbi:ApeA N-terminal domain 1-containing protein [Actinomycetospora sp. C-140]